MSSDAIAILGFVVLFVLMLLRVPVGMAMGLVGVSGFAYIVGGAAALKNVGHTTMRTVTDYNFAVVPLFLLMGAFATTSGMSRELFRGANAFLGHLRGGLGIATIAACGGFAAICGSSVATAATFSKVAYPEMRSYGYPQSFATGVIAAGGTLGIMIPPSTVLAIYGLITEQDVGKLFIAGVLPGILAVAMYMITITIIGAARPGFLPAGPRSSWKERIEALRDVWATLLLFAFVIGGIYGGVFTATEAAGAGAGGAFIIGVVRGRLSGRGHFSLAARNHAHHRRGIHGADRRHPVRLFPDRHPDAAESDGVPHRARARALRRARADHDHVPGARVPDGRARHDHPHRPDHLSRDQSSSASIRSGLASSS